MTELGEIPQEWEVRKIEDLYSVLTGATPLRGKQEYYLNGNVAWVKTLDLNDRYIYDTQEKITDLALKETSCKVQDEGTVLIAMYGGFNQIGRTGILKTKAATNQAICSLPLIEEIYPEYLNYFLIKNRNVWRNVAASTRKDPNITKGDVEKFNIIVPPLSEQYKIADILSTIDEQIDKTDALIEKTRELKKGLMQKLLIKGIGHTEFRDTEIGRIPKGWEVKKLEEIVQICYGKNQKEVEIEGGIYKILGTGGVIGNTNDYLWDKPSVLIGRKGTIDKPMYIEEPFWTVDTLFYTKVDEGYVAKWLYYYLNKIDLKKYNEATGVPSLSVAVLNTILILVPPFKEQQKISKILSAVDSDIDVYESKKNKLENAKKALMNHLLTGKIRVLVQ